VAQQSALVTDGLRGQPGLGQQVSAQQVRQRAGIDLVILEPGRGDRLAAAGVDQVRLQAKLAEQLRQPAPTVGGLEGDWGAGFELAETDTSSAESLGRLRLSSWVPSWLSTATCERLRWTSMPTYILILGLLP
jgi:hypothetical protein